MSSVMPFKSPLTTQASITLMSIATLSVPLVDCAAKLLSAHISTGEIVWARFILQALLLTPYYFICREEDRSFKLWYPALGLCLCAALVFLFWGLKYLPLANNIAIFFVEPFIVILLAALFLGEKITGRRMLAVMTGFLGVLIVIRPSWELYGPALFLPLCAATVFGGYVAGLRAFNNSNKGVNPVILQFWISLSSLGIMSTVMGWGVISDIPLFAMAMPEGSQWFWLFVGGAVALLGHVLMSIALRSTDAAILAPFQYLEILGATLLGWLVFKDIPDFFTVLGATIIIGSGIFLFLQERGKKL